MPSLLDTIIQSRTRMPSASELLQERSRQRSLLSGADAPAPTPNIFNPRPGGAQPGNLRSMTGAAEMAGAPGPEAADPRQLQSAAQEAGAEMRQREAAGVAWSIARVNNGELPPSAEGYIREVVEENEAGPGAPGRGFLGRLFAGDKVPGLSEAQNKKIRKESFLIAGLSLLGSDPNATLGQALASGVMLGRLQATNTAGELLDERQRQKRLQERYAVLSDTEMTELERLKEVRRRSLAEGDVDAAEATQSMIEHLENLRAGEAERQPVQGTGVQLWHDGEGNVYDADQNRLSAEVLAALQPQPDPVRGPVTQVTGRNALIDPTTGQVIRDLGPAGAGQGPDEGEVFQRTNSLADDFRQETGQIQESIALGSAADQAGDNSAGDLRLIFVFNKLIDPGSRITEGEVRAGKNLGGMNAQARGFYDRMAEGRLPPAACEELESEIQNMMESRSQQLGEVAQQYRQRAQQFGVNPDFVVRRGLIPDLSPSGGGGGNSPVRGGNVDAELDEIFGAGGS